MSVRGLNGTPLSTRVARLAVLLALAIAALLLGACSEEPITPRMREMDQCMRMLGAYTNGTDGRIKAAEWCKGNLEQEGET